MGMVSWELLLDRVFLKLKLIFEYFVLLLKGNGTPFSKPSLRFAL